MNTITISSSGKKMHRRSLYCKGMGNPEYVTYKIDSEKITIRRAGITTTGIVRSASYNNGSPNAFNLSVAVGVEQVVPLGKIPIDMDESDEDTLVAYFEDLKPTHDN